MLSYAKSAEKIIFLVLAIGILVGLVSAFVAPDFYDTVLSIEDGPLEWVTALSLFGASLICLTRAITMRNKGFRFVIITAFAGVILLFGAGEEISWGQRIIGWTSGDFWQQNNAQSETNLHNLMVGEVKINRVFFGVILTLGLLLYFAVLPILAAKYVRVRAFFNYWFVPIARPIHAYAFIGSLIAMGVIPSDRAPELGEFALGLLLLAVVLMPANKSDIL